MLSILKSKTDELYPYTIRNSWGETVSCTEKDLSDLKNAIEELLQSKENEE